MTDGDKIKRVRKAAKLTLDQVASALSLGSTGHLSQVENNKKEASPALIGNFKRAFSVSENWWNTGEGEIFGKTIVASFEIPYDARQPPQTIAEQIGPGYGPEVKLMADYLEVKIKGKTAEERLQIVEEIMEQIRSKYK